MTVYSENDLKDFAIWVAIEYVGEDDVSSVDIDLMLSEWHEHRPPNPAIWQSNYNPDTNTYWLHRTGHAIQITHQQFHLFRLGEWAP